MSSTHRLPKGDGSALTIVAYVSVRNSGGSSQADWRRPRNWLFAGADSGGETLACAMTLIETAKMNGLDPQAYLADVLDRIHDHKNNKLDELLLWNWTSFTSQADQAAA